MKKIKCSHLNRIGRTHKMWTLPRNVWFIEDFLHFCDFELRLFWHFARVFHGQVNKDTHTLRRRRRHIVQYSKLNPTMTAHFLSSSSLFLYLKCRWFLSFLSFYLLENDLFLDLLIDFLDFFFKFCQINFSNLFYQAVENGLKAVYLVHSNAKNFDKSPKTNTFKPISSGMNEKQLAIRKWRKGEFG